jgi:hypothetical protein
LSLVWGGLDLISFEVILIIVHEVGEVLKYIKIMLIMEVNSTADTKTLVGSRNISTKSRCLANINQS